MDRQRADISLDVFGETPHTTVMSGFIERQGERFADFGRVFAPELSSLPGTLEDVSAQGFRVTFPLGIEADMTADYTVYLHPAAHTPKKIELLCRPRWKKETAGVTEIGFMILPSHEYLLHTEYIARLSTELLPLENRIHGSVCQFI